MSRVIKFRAWEKGIISPDTLRFTRKPRMIYFGFKDYAWDQDGEQGACDIDIDQMPIMQFTGLLDKNGKEIWEMDIASQNSTIGVISYCQMDASFEHQVPKSGDWKIGPYISFDTAIDPDECVILGNIYEHPELLK